MQQPRSGQQYPASSVRADFARLSTDSCGRWAGACQSHERQPFLGVTEPVSAPCKTSPFLSHSLTVLGTLWPPQPWCVIINPPTKQPTNQSISKVYSLLYMCSLDCVCCLAKPVCRSTASLTGCHRLLRKQTTIPQEHCFTDLLESV